MTAIKLAAHAAHTLLAGALMIGFPIFAPWFILAAFLLARTLAHPVHLGAGEVFEEAQNVEVAGARVGVILLFVGLAAPLGLLSPDIPFLGEVNALAMRVGPLAAAVFIIKAAYTAKRSDRSPARYATNEAYEG